MSKERSPQPRLWTIDEVANIAKENLRRDGFHIHTVLAQGSGRTMAFQFTEFGPTPEERRFHMFEAGRFIGQEGTVGVLLQVFYVGEAWMSTIEAGKVAQQMPAQDPNRKEILIVSKLNIQGPELKNDVRIWQMARDSENKLVDIVEFDHDLRVEGSFLESFIAGYATGLLDGRE